MNRWKIAFWICFALLLATAAFGFYSILDQGVTITYMKDEFDDTDDALDEVIAIINNTDLSRQQIQTELLKIKDLDYVDFEEDTVFLDKIYLVFEENRLKKVGEQW
ncbi:MAG: hypothetical protein JNN04_08080 [Cyclobacteriaceae bacterium]|nr:hypothetical protein [Cyclobacteriaceae bacterium]